MITFPQTSPVSLTKNHMRFLEVCLQFPDGVLQRDIGKRQQMDKTTTSQVKADLIRIGWVYEVDLGSGREIKLKYVNDVKCFLSQFKFLKHVLLVRPHSILCRCLVLSDGGDFERCANALTQSYPTVISHLHNNKKYVTQLEFGKVEFNIRSERRLLNFWVDGFILPIGKKDIGVLEHYVTEGVVNRVLAMHSNLKVHFERFRLNVMDCVVLKNLHAGILLKSEVFKALSLAEEINGLGLSIDDSVYGCKELEAKGGIEEVTSRIKAALNLVFSSMGAATSKNVN